MQYDKVIKYMGFRKKQTPVQILACHIQAR